MASKKQSQIPAIKVPKVSTIKAPTIPKLTSFGGGFRKLKIGTSIFGKKRGTY